MEMTWVKAYEASLMYQAMGFGSAQSYNPNIEKKNRFKTSWKRVDEETAVEAKIILESLLHSEDFDVKEEKEKYQVIIERVNKRRTGSRMVDPRDVSDFLQLQRSGVYDNIEEILDSDQVLDIMLEFREKTSGKLHFADIWESFQSEIGEGKLDGDGFLRYMSKRIAEVGGEIDFEVPEGKILHKEFTEENLTFNENKPIGNNPLLDENGIDMFNVTEEDDIYTQEDKRRFIMELLEERAAQESLDEREELLLEKEEAMKAELEAEKALLQEREEAMNAELRAREAEIRAKEAELNEQFRLLMEERETFTRAYEEEMMKKIEEEVKQRKAGGGSIRIIGGDESDDSEFETGDDLDMYDEDGDFVGDIGEFDPNDCTAEELAELEIIFGYPIVAEKDVEEVSDALAFDRPILVVKDVNKVIEAAKKVEELLTFGHPIEAVKDVNKIIKEAAGDVDKIMELAVKEVSDALAFDHPILAVKDVNKVIEEAKKVEDVLTF